MTHCIRCHRPMKHPTDNGMGPKCSAKAGKPLPMPEHDRDLFGYDVDKAVEAARWRLAVVIGSATVNALMANRRAFSAATAERLAPEVWAR